ncbi:hypothetical protein FQN57_003317 [Myotisia sp. PD_48]|nr:hypothetical protein FQN57_003317 [Myotisia sp. PD_48]
MPVTWDVALEHKLLLHTLDPATKPDWDRVANEMGDGLTRESCRQHFQKLRRQVLGDNTEKADGDAPASPKPSTPTSARKRKPREPKDPNAPPAKRGRKPGKKALEAAAKAEAEKNAIRGEHADTVTGEENKENILKVEDDIA